jgi:hypothetical protein
MSLRGTRPNRLIQNDLHPTRGVYPDWRSRVEGLGDDVNADEGSLLFNILSICSKPGVTSVWLLGRLRKYCSSGVYLPAITTPSYRTAHPQRDTQLPIRRSPDPISPAHSSPIRARSRQNLVSYALRDQHGNIDGSQGNVLDHALVPPSAVRLRFQISRFRAKSSHALTISALPSIRHQRLVQCLAVHADATAQRHADSP